MKPMHQVETLENHIKQLEKENLLLQEKVAFLTHKLYGSSSERSSSIGIDGQMSFFDKAETTMDSKASEPDMKDIDSYRRKGFQVKRKNF